MEFKEKLKAIKDKITCVEVAQDYGLPITKAGDRCRSPFHDGTNPTSFVVYDNYWKSYSDPDKANGDVIDLYMYLYTNGNKGEAIRELSKKVGIELDSDYSSSNYTKQADILRDNILLWNEQLKPETLDYLHSRGINDTTISELKIGWDGQNIIIPCWKNGRPIYYAKRNSLYKPGSNQSKYMKATITGYNENELFGLQTLSRDTKTLIIAEGAFDYLSFYQEGYAVISGIGGTFNKEHRKRLIDIAKTYSTIYLTYDRDDNEYHTGQKFDNDMFDLLQPYCVDIRIVNIPPYEQGRPCKDVSDYYQITHYLKPLLDNAISGYLWKARTFKGDIEALSAWIKPVAIRYPNYRLTEVFEGLKHDGLISESSLKALEKLCMNSPEESTVINELLKYHTIIYTPGLNFFEWKNGYWNSTHDNIIQGYIGAVLGHKWNTYNRSKGCLEHLKTDPRVLRVDIQFNHSNCINFRNGTLDIKQIDLWNGEQFNNVREPRQEDYLTYRLPYNYDPEARNLRWEKFIYEITNYTPDDAIQDNTPDAWILQQFVGYILYNDNRLHKALVLEGEASNGKSVFVNTIAKLFTGEQRDSKLPNVTSVSVDSLAQRFNAIDLVNSMLNINTELKSNIAGAEDKFKQAVAGDMLRDSFKGKDSVEFRTRAKFIISLNEPIRSSDITEGFYRRLLIVEFPLRFTLNPTLPNDRLADITLEDQFSTPESLSGIFNWAYRGYQMLWNNNYKFYESKSSERMKTYIERSNDYILDWALDYELQDKTTYETLWNDYKIYCETANIRITSEPKFKDRIGKLVNQGKLNWKKQRLEHGGKTAYSPNPNNNIGVRLDYSDSE